MDRNLGALSATPSDGNKTYGLYYEFGRKDPFTFDINRYDINGNSIGKTELAAACTFAKGVQTPDKYHITIIMGPGDLDREDWVSPNKYISKEWNYITSIEGKNLFDPSPMGWKLPTRSDFSKLSKPAFQWDNNNRGSTYNANWFPTAGTYSGDGTGMHGKKNYGWYWSASPYTNKDCSYYLSVGDNGVDSNDILERDWGCSIRCVPDK